LMSKPHQFYAAVAAVEVNATVVVFSNPSAIPGTRAQSQP
jgi:hypothetical protein